MDIDLKLLEFRKLDLEGVKALVSWAQEEGWNPGPSDAEVYYNTDSDGHYGYFLQGKMIAGGSVVSYHGDFGFMGLFIVKPSYRLSGIGRSLWYRRRDLLLSRLKPGAAIGMDGVVAMQAFYHQGGFEFAFRDERHARTGAAFEVEEHVSLIHGEDMESILDLDSRGFGFSRPQFLKPWLSLPGNVNLKYKKDGKIRGFSVMRKVSTGYKIGPLFAEDITTARSLYEACLNAVPGQQVFLDISSDNNAAVEMVKNYKTTFVFECARMYYGTPPLMDLEKVFGITTFELG